MSNRSTTEFAGLEGFIWFQGVVEDRNDPLNVGRLRVRIYGWHSNNRQELPTSNLPWAQVMSPINSASMSGIGIGPTGPVEGTTVIGFFMDGKNAQIPLIIGTLSGLNTQQSGLNESGFQDPNGKYPLEVGYPDTPKLAYDRWELDDVTTAKTEGREQGIALVSGTWDEPEQRGGASSRYPFNHVTRSESGHVREIDDTEGAERIHEYHKSGTFYEIQSDGSRVVKVKGTDYEIVINNKNVYVKGSCNLTIDSNAQTLIKGDYDLKVEGTMTIHNDVNIDGKSIATDDHLSAGISGKGHFHLDTPGLGAGATTKPKGNK